MCRRGNIVSKQYLRVAFGRLNAAKRATSRIANAQLVLVLLATLALAPLAAGQTAHAAAPPLPDNSFTLLAAGERASVTAVTPLNTPTNNNGTGWYRNGNSMGFAPEGATIEQSSADITGIFNGDTAANPYRLSWHTQGLDGVSIDGGWRAGSNESIGDGWTRYVYQSNSPEYYPAGPQANVNQTTVTSGGWTLCWSGSYGDSGKLISELFGTDCTQDYLMYAASGTLANLIDVSRGGETVLNEVGGSHHEDTRLYVGDTLDFSLQLSDGITDTPWSDYRVYTSNCIVSADCSPGDPVNDASNWDAGTHVTDGTYTIPSGAEREQLYVYQADDETGEAQTSLNAIRLTISHTPVGHEVSSCEELQAIDDEIDANQEQDIYLLTQDIDCTGVDLGYGLDWDGAFEGTFDGQGHTISNITIVAPNESYAGLFRQLNRATIQDLTLSGGSISGGYEVGGLAGYAYNTNISNVHTNLTVVAEGDYGYYTGGLVGYYEVDYSSATISDSSVEANVTSQQGYAGGFIGYFQQYGYNESEVTEFGITRSYYNGSVTAGDSYVGGLIGYAYVDNEDDGYEAVRLEITNSYTQGSVNSENGSDAGGLIGYVEVYNDEYESVAELEIDRSYSSSSVISNNLAGGLIGEVDMYYVDENITISNSFAAGLVEAREGSSYALIGSGSDFTDNSGALFTAENVWFDETTTNQSYPYYPEAGDWYSVNGEGDQADYFKNNSTNPPLDTWDFENIWVVNENDYPTFGLTQQDEEIVSAEDGSKITVEQTGCDVAENTSTAKESGLVVQDPAYSYPLGFVGFHLTGCSNGGTATVTVTFTGTFNPDDVTARKYNPNTNGFTTIVQASKTVTTLDGNPALQITYTITDGGELDQDGQANGTIVDPVGLALQAVGAPNTGLGARR